MTNWLPVRAQLARPYARSLADHIARQIETEKLTEGMRLPPFRETAARTGLSIQTVSRAFDELAQRQLVESVVGRGTFVKSGLTNLSMPFSTEPVQPDILDLSLLRPVRGELHIQRLQETLGELSRQLPHDVALSFRPNIGLERHQKAGASWLEQCGLSVDHRAVIVTNGVSPALALALAAVTRSGDAIATDTTTHHGLIALATYSGLRIVALDCDGQGTIPQSLDAVCRRRKISALFTVPTLANPMASLMPAERREAIAKIATRHGVPIIEDDVYGPLPEGRPPPIAAFAPEETFYMTSVTKSLAPGLRTGFLIVPRRTMSSIINRHRASSWAATPLIAECVSRWIENGTAEKLLTWQRQALETRNRIVQQTFPDNGTVYHPHALHFWLRLPAQWREEDFVVHLRQNGIVVAPGQPFLVNGAQSSPAVRISIGSPLRPGELEAGLKMISELMMVSDPEPIMYPF